MFKHFWGMEETDIIVDDLVVLGQTQKELDKQVQLLLESSCTTEVKLNPAKFEMSLNAITFMRHQITSKGN